MGREAAWTGLRRALEVEVFRRPGGVAEVAREIPATRQTVYRLLRSNRPPSLAIEAGVRRVVESSKARGRES